MPIVREDEIRSRSKRYVLGHICHLDDGTKIYLARRKHREQFRSGRKSISGAMTEQVCGWAIDELTLLNVRTKGVVAIGVRTIDTGDIFLAPLKSWFDRKVYKDHDYTGVGRGGSRQRLLYLRHFLLKKGSVQLDESKLV